MIVVMCDTNGGTMPEEIAALTKEAAAAVDVPLGIHTHNDCDLAVANSLAAIDAGAVHVQGTINGLGERCGNADLVSVVANLALKKKGYEVLGGVGMEHLTELSRYVYEIANMHLRVNQPFVGPSAFAHKGGMHVHAVNRVAESYEHITPESVGNTRRVLVSELSGRSNIVALTNKSNVQPDSALMETVLKQVVDLENKGYQFEAAEASFDLLVQRAAGKFKPHFQLLHYHVDVETVGDGETTTEATVKLRIGEEIRHEVAEGDGPVNALDAALRKALNGRFPNLRDVQLVDYKVRVINSDAGTAAAVRVVIESQDADGKTWGTVGVNENVIKASWDALVDSIEYKLCKDEK
jgi:2-isopropylmalate synthase